MTLFLDEGRPAQQLEAPSLVQHWGKEGQVLGCAATGKGLAVEGSGVR